ncbi:MULTISPECIES: class Ib ribonucleoside-diphosphate reductase assembly flavoprotein NrdI [Cellulomonas]|uniref:Protein NrdI n=1 Tax=Cellulomonas uda TaxID=1714 RepID=A0A4Y3K797_CELUD|nr:MULTISPECIES: class Ib ribonucleoside-diphosphate reductase assembly flavoprotein NrdI [Cellulomonas]ASR53990.1 class Ib ribonucleoside-diphosphate reductase assembly flavoprotein NrdI [Cellulomonas sp. PSBB021]NII66770.1 protein involved in ribonucleotide reduction [Cellulomonas uda]GEA80411.1 protein NrdI [Cellulomonas uda]
MRVIPVYYYSSASGLVRSFAQRLERPVHDLAQREVRLSEADGPWVLLTPSYKTGNDANDTVPEAVRRFLRSAANRRRLVGVIGSGNRNFGRYYQDAARLVARASGRPVLFEFELAGTPWDVEECRRLLADLDAALDASRADRPLDEGPAGTGRPEER